MPQLFKRRRGNIVVAFLYRMRMDSRDPKPFERKIFDRLGPDKRDIEIARHKPLVVKRLAFFIAMSGNRTAAEHRRGFRRNAFSKRAAKLVKLLTIAVKREPDRIFAFLLVGKFRL